MDLNLEPALVIATYVFLAFVVAAVTSCVGVAFYAYASMIKQSLK